VVTYFWLKNPKSRTKIMRLGGEDRAAMEALHAIILKHVTKS
jgi:hypothetical protein